MNHESPKNRFLKALREMDKLLDHVDQIMVASNSHSPFNNYLTRLSDDQAKLVKDGIGELRAGMLILTRDAVGLSNEPHINTTWAVRRTLDSANEKMTEIAALAMIAFEDQRDIDIQIPEKLMGQMKGTLKRLDAALT